ncbi:MAG TPA: ribose-5-phosphate isomerase RpiA [Phycisphaerae bacterium]|nr:ribose-5-phosphate isomerase RpiA [Phycisphaerae bacterium]
MTKNAGSDRAATVEQLERLGQAASRRVEAGQRVGLGSGKAALAFVRALGERVRGEGLKIVGVPTSVLTERVAREAGIEVATLEEVAHLDIAIDGADEVDPALNVIKGGGGNLLREKVVESLAAHLIIVVGEEKLVETLGTKFPVFVEVVEFARPVLVRQISAMGATVTQRMAADGKAFLTDNGNPYLHCRFPPGLLGDPAAVDTQLRALAGVVGTGLFVGMAAEAMVARFDGGIETLKPRK